MKGKFNDLQKAALIPITAAGKQLLVKDVVAVSAEGKEDLKEMMKTDGLTTKEKDTVSSAIRVIEKIENNEVQREELQEFKNKLEDSLMKGKLTEPEKVAFETALKVCDSVTTIETGGVQPLQPLREDAVSECPPFVVMEEPMYVQNIKKFITNYGWIFMLLGFLVTIIKLFSIINGMLGGKKSA